jgi:hypothetical protein
MTVRDVHSLAIIVLAFASMGGDCTLAQPVPLCGEKPVVFQAEAGCGPGGPIGVQQPSTTTPQYETLIDISNANALGLPPTDGTSCVFTSGSYHGPYVTGDAGVCPRWEQGSWELNVICNCTTGCPVLVLERCTAVLANGEGTLTCRPTDGGAPCTSHLTEVPDGGTD